MPEVGAVAIEGNGYIFGLHFLNQVRNELITPKMAEVFLVAAVE
jgi:hypothetical protein